MEELAKVESNLKSIFNFTPAQGDLSVAGITNQLSLVQDPYSGKYYGSGSYQDMVSDINGARSYYEQAIHKASTSGGFGQPVSPYMNMGKVVDPLADAQAGLEALNAFKIPEEANYVQQEKMIESYQKYGTGWDKFFESSYKTPRLQEDNAKIAQQNLKAQDSSDGTATGNPLIPNNLGIRKEIGTGVGKSSTGLNPFGQLDAGLNI